MDAIHKAEREWSSELTDAPSRVPVRKLALFTGLTCVIAQLLPQILGGTGDAHGGPLGVVLGQTLWNAAQVGLLLLLLCLWRLDRHWRSVVLTIATLACLPFALYALSPGGWAFTMLLLTTCAFALARGTPDLGVTVVDASRGTPLVAKFEFLAFVCNLLCSMYNFAASRTFWPYWASIFEAISKFVGFTPDLETIARGMYTLGLDGVSLPSYIEPGSPASNLGAVVFFLIWTVLPFLYVIYFAVLAKLAKNSPGTRLQQALCLFCIFHFLFLTDIVDYRFGRGITNPATHWAHWSEVFAWRIAVLLPIYQKFAAGEWRRGNGMIGVVLHYAIAAWAVFFLVYEVLLLDVLRFFYFATGQDQFMPFRPFGLRPEALGYHGALVLLTFLYGFMVVAMRCKRISIFGIETRPGKSGSARATAAATQRTADCLTPLQPLT